MSRLHRGYRKASIKLANVALPQKLIGPRHAVDPLDAQFLRQPSLPGSEIPFPSSSSLRRVGRNHLNPQFLQGPSHLRRPRAIDRLTGFRGMEEMASPIAVERTESAFSFDDFPQSGHHRGGRFFFHQLRVVDLAGGIVENHQQIESTLILKPSVRTAIQMQQHPRQRAPWPPPPMYSSFPTLLHQPGHL